MGEFQYIFPCMYINNIMHGGLGGPFHYTQYSYDVCEFVCAGLLFG